MKQKFQAITAKIKAKWPIRKGCFHCGSELNTSKEKFTRSCNDCAAGARDGFERMASGEFKEGMNDVLNVAGLGSKKEATKEVMQKALDKKRGKIVKRLKKKGLDQETINKHLAKFDDETKL